MKQKVKNKDDTENGTGDSEAHGRSNTTFSERVVYDKKGNKHIVWSVTEIRVFEMVEKEGMV